MSSLEYFSLATGPLVVVLVVTVVDFCLGFVLLGFDFEAGVGATIGIGIVVKTLGDGTILGRGTDLDLGNLVEACCASCLGADVICFLTGAGFEWKTGC